MANDVVLGAAMRSNLLSLQNTQRSIDATQLRLATGKKVNSALDNPQSFFQAQSLNNRASDLTRLLDGIGQSIQAITEADKGVTSLTNLVSQAQSIADQAQSEIRAAQGFSQARGTKDLSAITNLQGSGVITGTSNQFTLTFKPATGAAVTQNINIAANSTVYDIVAAVNSNAAINTNVRASVNTAGQLQFDSLKEGGFVRLSSTGGTAMTAAGFAELGLGDLVSQERTGTGTATTSGVTNVAGRVISSSAIPTNQQVNGQYVASTTLVNAGFMAAGADDVTLTISADGVSATTTTITGATTVQGLLDAINTSSLGSKVTASLNTTTGKVDLTFAEGVGKVALQINDIAGGVNTTFGFGTGAANGAIAAGVSKGEAFNLIGSSANLTQFQTDFNKVRAQIDGIVTDANYRGVNLLKDDDLTTFFNEDRSNSLVTQGIDFTALGLGVAKADFSTESGVQKSIDQAQAALEKIRAFGSSIANDLSIIQTRQDFTKETINTLKAGASALTDADLNEEGATLLALQTAQQLGVTSLSLASQSQQSVLRLF